MRRTGNNLRNPKGKIKSNTTKKAVKGPEAKQKKKPKAPRKLLFKGNK